MSTRRNIALCSALAAVVLALGVSSARADRESGKRRLWDTDRERTFAFSIEHSGRIGDDMVIEGVRYRMSRNLSVYFVGQGVQPQGVQVSKSVIYLAGQMRGNDGIVSTVIVRPASVANGADPSMNVRVRPAGAPQ